QRTVFVSTHLIAEFEGLIDEFTLIDQGREVMTLEADAARERFQRIHARFAGEAPMADLHGAHEVRRRGREMEVVVHDGAGTVVERLRELSPEALSVEALTLEEIFTSTLGSKAVVT
ncbi:MAG TPA: hypothetical protein VLA20_09930, partial [Vicinamibacterales bacterium]|nr:hypothetical protein [Vicinamibacterales bacterium]